MRHHNVFLAPPGAWDGLFDATECARAQPIGTHGQHAGARLPRAHGNERCGLARRADVAWGGRISTEPMHFYVHAPARTDPSVVERPSDDAIMVLVPVPPLPEGLAEADVADATERLTSAARAAVIRAFERAGMAGFADAIVHERVRTPPGWREAYGLRRGSVFGLSRKSWRRGRTRRSLFVPLDMTHLRFMGCRARCVPRADPLSQLSYLRPGRRHGARAPGVHWVGASTRPGNGVPLVLIGAKQTAAEVLSDLDRSR